MFEITEQDVRDLSDTDLRALVARLCEAELLHHGLASSGVTWGGEQDAPDGGIDVRVELPAATAAVDFLPRRVVGLQVKTSKMPPAAISQEMRPDGFLRASIRKLAMDGGAYIIVSGAESLTDSVLARRRAALRDAISDVDEADRLLTDFYDAQRIATWVRKHDAVAAWARHTLGRPLSGWQPYGNWSCSRPGLSDYIKDNHVRLGVPSSQGTRWCSVEEGIDWIRDALVRPGSIVRMVGLSGVGKTRLAEALFDARMAARPLPACLVVYGDAAEELTPSPQDVLSSLLAKGQRAILVVDNCASALHRYLQQRVGSKTSGISVLTIEYDIRDDQPEQTAVVSLGPASDDVIATLVRRVHPHILPPDAQRVATFSGGNARMAFALASTVQRGRSSNAVAWRPCAPPSTSIWRSR